MTDDESILYCHPSSVRPQKQTVESLLPVVCSLQVLFCGIPLSELVCPVLSPKQSQLHTKKEFTQMVR